ncbi:hypothetical protein E2562_014324 [Oryza meyeriana var. granulata]|uniref:Leucine-rich repeat-containing N-terminal plant-type domain-containing protein n=1 Tax=Oryza meyeriana var. granulata TaxID=110450 RepID=A0A6G1C4X2_9ORYZ|nr:hypothetical protein E2562_014324 [Oryza meyeriana var. granulata]
MHGEITNDADDDELALLSFRSSLLYDEGSLLASWNTSGNGQHCTWPGVVCGRRHPDRVVKLWLPSSDLSGTISPSLGNLSFLRKLDLSGNHLSGEIPPELGRLSRLRWMDLSDNSLQGSIPAAIGACTHLTGMDLTSNRLRGTIPLQIGAGMKNLALLYLGENGLSGEIPASLAELPSIQLLSIRNNRLSASKLSLDVWCCLACVLPCGALDVVRIVHLSGHVDEFSCPVTAGAVLAAHPNHTLNTVWSSASVGCPTKKLVIVSPDSELKHGHIYFLIPSVTLPADRRKKSRPSSKKSKWPRHRATITRATVWRRPQAPQSRTTA